MRGRTQLIEFSKDLCWIKPGSGEESTYKSFASEAKRRDRQLGAVVPIIGRLAERYPGPAKTASCTFCRFACPSMADLCAR